MKRMLKQREIKVWHYVEGSKVIGPPPGLRGDVSDLWGDVTGLRGDVTGLRGNATGLLGDVDKCEITDAERAAGVDVSDLIAAQAAKEKP